MLTEKLDNLRESLRIVLKEVDAIAGESPSMATDLRVYIGSALNTAIDKADLLYLRAMEAGK